MVTKSLYCFAVILLLHGLSRPAEGAIIVQTASFSDHTYHLVASDEGGAISWTDAEAFATTLGGHLVTVNSAEENTFLLNTFGPTVMAAAPLGSGLVSLWLGLSDEATEGDFVWSSGAAVTYTNWKPGEPASSYVDEDFIGMLAGPNWFGSPGEWHDIVPGFAFNDFEFGVVEVSAVPEPSSFLMLCGSAIGLFRSSRRRIVTSVSQGDCV